MAILGVQLVITLIAVSVIQRLSPYYSFSRWLLCSTGLTKFLYPTNAELRSLMHVPKKGKKSRNKVKEDTKSLGTFYVPKNLDIELESVKITAADIVFLRYYQDYHWLVDFALHASIVYFLTEVYSTFSSINNEINLSMLWCLIVLIYSIKIITSLTSEYFRGTESMAERSSVIVMGFVYLVIVMIIMIIDESTIETGLDSAYANFSAGAMKFLNEHGFSSHGPASKLILKFSLAVWSSFLGAMFVFPGLRLAKMHYDALTYCKEKRFMSVILNINFISPLLLCLLWIKPVSRDYFTSRIFLGMSKPLFSIKSFESLRLILVIICMLLRLSVMPIYLQAYLNMAYYRIKDLKSEVGKITNIDLQKKVVSISYYLCVVVLQYLIPLVICLFLTLMYKTLGEYEWRNLSDDSIFSLNNLKKFTAPVADKTMYDNATCEFTNINDHTLFLQNDDVTTDFIKKSVHSNDTDYALHINVFRQIFTKEVYRGVLGFSIWWTCFSWFISSNSGLLYYMYFRNI